MSYIPSSSFENSGRSDGKRVNKPDGMDDLILFSMIVMVTLQSDTYFESGKKTICHSRILSLTASLGIILSLIERKTEFFVR